MNSRIAAMEIGGVFRTVLTGTDHGIRLWPPTPHGESSKTGQIERVVCGEGIMISNKVPGCYPCHSSWSSNETRMNQ